MIEFIKTGGKKRNKVGGLTRYTTPNQDDSKAGLKVNEGDVTTPGNADRSLTPMEHQDLTAGKLISNQTGDN